MSDQQEPARQEPTPPKPLAEQLESEGYAWYKVPGALKSVMNGPKYDLMIETYSKCIRAGLIPRDENGDFIKPDQMKTCGQMFAMFEYLLLNAPKVMEAYLDLQTQLYEAKLAAVVAQRANRSWWKRVKNMIPNRSKKLAVAGEVTND